eukprot:3562519-Amphidinium_carterae.1
MGPDHMPQQNKLGGGAPHLISMWALRHKWQNLSPASLMSRLPILVNGIRHRTASDPSHCATPHAHRQSHTSRVTSTRAVFGRVKMTQKAASSVLFAL